MAGMMSKCGTGSKKKEFKVASQTENSYSSTPKSAGTQQRGGLSQEAAIKQISQGQTRLQVAMENVLGSLSNLDRKIDFLSNGDHIDPKGGADMSNFTREELDAKLGQNKAEVESVASSMRADMAQWREQNNTQMAAIQTQLSALNSKIDGKFEGMEGKIDGLKTTSATVQWMVAAILGLLALAVSLPSIQDYMKSPSTATSVQQQPAASAEKNKTEANTN